MLRKHYACHPEHREGSQFVAKPGFFASLRMTTKVVLLALLCLTGCGSASPQDRTALTRPELTDLMAQLQRSPTGPGVDLRITTLVASREMWWLLLQVRVL